MITINIKYKNIQRAVREYKKARNDREKNRAFIKLRRYFDQHYKALISITKDINYDINPKVKQLILNGLPKSKHLSTSSLEYALQGIFSGYTVQDIEQLIDSIMIDIINSYKHESQGFINYVSFLLPRRFGNKYMSMSRDANNQFYNIQLDSFEDIDSFDPDMEKTNNVYKYSFIAEFIDKWEYEFLIDMLNEVGDEYLLKNYDIVDVDFEKERIRLKATNIIDFVFNAKQYIEDNQLISTNLNFFKSYCKEEN